MISNLLISSSEPVGRENFHIFSQFTVDMHPTPRIPGPPDGPPFDITAICSLIMSSCHAKQDSSESDRALAAVERAKRITQAMAEAAKTVLEEELKSTDEATAGLGHKISEQV